MFDDKFNEYENLLIKSYNTEKEINEILKANINVSNETYLLFGYFMGYFSSKNELSLEDIKEILFNYQKENLQGKNFQEIYGTISFLFCQQYFTKNNNNINNNNNNFQNSLISSNNSNFNKNNIFNSNFNNFPNKKNQNNNNDNNNSQFNNNNFSQLFENPNNQNIKNSFNNQNSYLENSNNQNIKNSFNNQNSYFENSNNQNIKNSFNNQNSNFENSNNQIYSYKNDEEIAKFLEAEERFLFNKEQENNKQLKKCEICLEEFSLLNSNNYFLTCNCTIHDKCFDEYVKSQVEQNNLPIKCPSCGKDVHPNFIQESLNLNQELLTKYFKFSMNKFLNEYNNEYSSCPTPGCEYAFFFNKGEFRFSCPLCKKEYCLNCKDEWHKNLTCQQYRDTKNVDKLDKQFMDFVTGAKFKMCPRCKFWVEKNQGCNHMRCRCGADFCYLCGEFMDMKKGHKCKKK